VSITENGALPAAVRDLDDFERIPPHDLAAEQSVLGGMMLSKSAIGDVVTAMRPQDHYRPAHQIVHEAILSLYGRGEPADAVAVAAELVKRGDIARVGGAPYLHTLIASVPTAANAGYYARIVRERAVLRRLIEFGTRTVQLGYAGDTDADDLMRRAARAMNLLLADELAGGGGVLIGEALPEALRAIDDRTPPAGLIRTGFQDMDSLFAGGLKAGQLVIVAGRPALGKSTVALDISRYASIRDGKRGLFWSLEMGRQELLERLISAESRAPLHSIRLRQVTDEHWQKIQRRISDIASAPLVLDDNPDGSVAALWTALWQAQATGKPFEYVVVDYLQLMTPARRMERRELEVSEMSRALKLLAKEFGIPVILVCQLNRGPEARKDRRPELADLRESGSLEQNADIVVLLHREDAYERESPRAGEADFIVAKHRNGPTATVTVAFQGHYSRFVDMAVI
jgi:replicative DNA helicase